MMRSGVAWTLLVAVLGVTAFTPPPPRLFGPPRTRAQALAYAKQAVFKDADKDSVATPVPHLKGSRQGRVDMIIDLGRVSGARSLSPTKRYNALARPHRTTLHALQVCFSVLACWPSRGPPRRIRRLGATLNPAPTHARDLHQQLRTLVWAWQ